jgi:Flp pilus assembly protein TadG
MHWLATDYGIASAKESNFQIADDQAALAAVKELTVVNVSQSSVGSVAKSLPLNDNHCDMIVPVPEGIRTSSQVVLVQ